MRLPARVAVLASFVLLGCPGTTTPPASLEISPSPLALDVGESRTITASVKQGDKLTPATGATWTTSDASVVTVSGSANGSATVQGVAAGTATLTAKTSDFTATVSVTVSASTATLSSIEVTPANAELAAGTTGQLTATGIFSDNSTRNITTQVTWNSSNEPVLTVSASGLVTALTPGTATVTATLAGKTATLLVTVTGAALERIALTPTLPSIAAGLTQKFTATGTFADGSTQDLSTQVTWSSSAVGVATVDDEGLARGLTAGTALITATLDGISGGTTLTVTAATLSRIDLEPSPLSLAKGRRQQLTARGHFSDGTTQVVTTQVSWSSDTPTVLNVSAAGEVNAIDVGMATVTATLGSISKTLTVTVTAATLVSLEVTPALPSVALGQTQQFAATGTYSDNTTQTLTDQVTWLSTATTVATVSNAAGSRGLVSTVGAGTAVISASLGAITASTTLTVTNAVLTQLQVTPANPTLPLGVKQTFTATGIFSDGTQQNLTTQVTWATDANTVATISNAAGTNGELTPVAVGTTAVRATQGTITGNTNVTVTAATLSRIDVTPAAPSLAKGRTQQLVATGTFSDGSNQNLTAAVTWTSATPARVTVSNASGSQGLASALDVGSSVVTATLSGVSGSTTLTVTNAVLTSIAVTPATRSIARGLTQQYVATGTFSDTTQQNITAQVTWSSGTPATATISNATGSNGLATAVAQGTSVITAALGGISGTANLTVTAASLVSLTVTPSTASIPAGRTQQYTATGTYTDATNQDLTATVTWTTGTPATATISNAAGSRGLATGVAMGSSTVVATLGGVTGTANLTVTSAVLESITVAPATVSVVAGATTQLTASGHYSDGSQLDLTTAVTWSSDATARATVSNAAGSQGLVTGVTAGTANVSATQGTVTSAAVVTVTPAAATLVSIAVTPANPSAALGRTQQFVATGTYSDSSSADLSATVTWASATTSVATINATGLATSVSQGTSVVSATLGAVSGSTTLTVGPAVVVSVAVTPASPTVARGLTQQFTATATYSDGSALDVSATATWASATPSVATISASGLATGVAEGTSVISALVGGLSGSTTLTVGPAVLVSIDVAPNPLPVTVGGTDVVSVTGTYSDGSLASVAATATYTPADASIATVSGGTVSGHAAGSTVITVAVGSVSTTFTVNVTAAVTLSVSSTSPASGATGVSSLTSIAVTFSAAVNPATVTTQTSSGVCTGSIQVSRDDFASCIALAAATMSGGDTVATVTASPALAFGGSYKIRVTTSVQTPSGIALSSQFVLTNAFVTAADTTTCPTTLLISQVYGGGGTGGASAFGFDFVELHNPTNAAMTLNGKSLQYSSATGTGTWGSRFNLPAASIPAGGYYLVQLGAATSGSVSNTLPPVNASSGTISMSAVAGKIALVNGTTALNGVCPDATVIDSVGYGATNCSEGMAAAPATSATTWLIRASSGNRDTNNNATDFSVTTTVMPRNASSATNQCARAANESGEAGEFDYCNMQFPTSLSVQTGVTSPMIYSQAYEAGVTGDTGTRPGIFSQFGYGPVSANPQNQSGWTWFSGTRNTSFMSGSNDEYQGSFTAPAVGTYRYGTRISLDGVNWTYCDLNGAGSNAGLDFDPSQLPVMTVTP